MKVKWKKLFALVVMWLATEIFLNFLGVDDIADYSEFVAGNATESFVRAAFCIAFACGLWPQEQNGLFYPICGNPFFLDPMCEWPISLVVPSIRLGSHNHQGDPFGM